MINYGYRVITNWDSELPSQHKNVTNLTNSSQETQQREYKHVTYGRRGFPDRRRWHTVTEPVIQSLAAHAADSAFYINHTHTRAYREAQKHTPLAKPHTHVHTGRCRNTHHWPFKEITDISHGTYLSCGGFFDNYFITNLLPSMTTEKFWKEVTILVRLQALFRCTLDNSPVWPSFCDILYNDMHRLQKTCTWTERNKYTHHHTPLLIFNFCSTGQVSKAMTPY